MYVSYAVLTLTCDSSVDATTGVKVRRENQHDRIFNGTFFERLKLNIGANLIFVHKSFTYKFAESGFIYK